MTSFCNFFNPSKENSFGYAANKKIGKAKDLSAPRRIVSILTASLNNQLKKCCKRQITITVPQRGIAGVF
jgi:hypothetical protein